MENVIFKTDHLKIKITKSPWHKGRKQIMIMTTFEGYKPIVIQDEEFTVIAKRWLSLQENRESEE